MVFDGRYGFIGFFVGLCYILTAGFGAVIAAVALVGAISRVVGFREQRHVDVAAWDVLNRRIIRFLQSQCPVGIRDDESGDFHHHTAWIRTDADRMIGAGNSLCLCRHYRLSRLWLLAV